jgi:hypothetical protein
MKNTLTQNLCAAALIAALGAAPAYGKECKGITFPEKTEAGGTALTLNGVGVRQATAFKVNVYVAGLYVVQTSTDANAILASNTSKKLVLQFVRDVGAADLSKGWQEGFDHNAKSQLPALKERIEKLKTWMADMKTGQRLTFVAKPNAGVEVIVNETVKGTIEGDDFAKAFLSIWLGAAPPNTGLKAGLLGGHCG